MKKIQHGGNIYEIAERFGLPQEEILDFSANINPLGVPQSFQRALVEHMKIIENYPDPQYKGLVESIAQYHGIDTHQITVGNGAAEIIFQMIAGIGAKRALILAPTFSEYERALKKAKSEVVYYRLKEEADFQIEDDFYQQIDETLDLVILCNPNNPTGQVIPREQLCKIAHRCQQQNIHLIIDEAFNEFLLHPEKMSMIPYVEQYENLHIIRSLTKFFAMPGLRIGYGITSNERLYRHMEQSKEPWTVNAYAALAGEIVLKDEAYIQKSRAWIEQERKALYEALKKIEGLKVYPPEANYIFLKHINGGIDLRAKLIPKKILVRSCANYENLDEQFYRVAIKDPQANLQLVQALKEVLYED